MRFNVLITPRMMPGGTLLLKSLIQGAQRAGVDARQIRNYRYDPGAVLVTYGMGGSDRLPHGREQLARGGRVIAFDAGYWHRKLSELQRGFRVSLDGLHCPQFIMRGPNPGPARWSESGLRISRGGDPQGPILLAGNAPKSIAIGAGGWTAARAAQIRKQFPDKQIAYRPKPKKPPEHGIDYDQLSTGDTARAVAGAALVVCRHSNIAVDACMAGVPVVCDDGAAAAIYPNELARATEQPSAETRLEFLHRLAWWQWSPAECLTGEVWPWLLGVLSEEFSQPVPAHDHR